MDIILRNVFNYDFFLCLSICIILMGLGTRLHSKIAKKVPDDLVPTLPLTDADLMLFSFFGAIVGIISCFVFKKYLLIVVFVVISVRTFAGFLVEREKTKKLKS